MYIYLENNFFIPLSEIISIVDTEEYFKSKYGKEFLEHNKKLIIDLSERKRKSLVITDKYIYISSYTVRAIYSRGYEFEKIKKKAKMQSKLEVSNE